jgi:3,5-epimerase/4-reductase
MKVLVYGGKGWIGQQVCDLMEKANIPYKLSTNRADDTQAVKSDIWSHNPSHVLCLVGRTHGNGINTIDYLEQPGKLTDNLQSNLMAPIVLALICSRMNVHLTYIGTGCIFDSFEDPTKTPYTEDDKPNFFGSSYSIVKGCTDQLMHLFDETVLNLRIRMPITDNHHPRNFITKILSYEKICSIPNSMSVLPELLPIMIDMMKQRTTGTFNFTNPGVISHNEILHLYKEFVDPQLTWQNFSIDEQNLVLRSKRSNNQLDTSKLERMYPNVTHIREAVIKNMKRFSLCEQ